MAVFKARARTLDLLGRQQIAGRPTAISELLKNAHDAYAKAAVIDFYRSDGLFVLRDDGVGMTRKEFEERWLTLGTESKAFGSVTRAASRPPKGERQRQLLGEKGIGRLAIASIGDQVLILTRARDRSETDEVVAAFIAWGIFASPGLDLGDVEVPVRTFQGRLPTETEVQDLVQAAKISIKALSSKVDAKALERILKEIKAFDVDPKALSKALGPPSLGESGHGTHFYIKPADENLAAELDERDAKGGVSRLQRLLVGFTNTMAPRASSTDFVARFVDHRTDDSADDVLSEGFFKPADFKQADHRISGRFDASGRFSGNLRIYEKEMSYTLPSPFKRRATTACGPFGLEFAYVQGDIKDSLLYESDQEAYYRLSKQLEHFGGLYIYRDGVRVLPYGNPEVDFLGIEERRSKGAGYYFFSYRRMFGAIDLTSKDNGRLQEKAGREGFIEDEAYRHLRSLMINLLVQLAADKFRADVETADEFASQRAAINQREELRRRREEVSKAKRAEFDKQIKEAAQRISQGEPRTAITTVLADLKGALAAAAAKCAPEEAAAAVARAEAEALDRVEQIRADLEVEKPVGVGLSDRMQSQFDEHAQRLEILTRGPLADAKEKIESITEAAERELKAESTRRRRAEAAIGKVIDAARRRVGRAKARLDQLQTDAIARLKEVTEEATADNAKVIAEATAQLQATAATGAGFSLARAEMSERIARTAEKAERLISRAADTLEVLKAALASRLAETPDDITEALEEQILALKDRERIDLEVAQLGMAIEVINHEFAASIKGVRLALRRLREWSEANKQLAPVYDELRSTFDHLDGYLTLFTPLQRRLYRSRATITGSNIMRYLEHLFGERTSRHEITLSATKSFLAVKFSGYPSTFYPVFVNLIDNAMYWLKDARGDRSITLDAEGDAMIVRDSGPGIPVRDRSALFRRGFSRKPAGRGLGLYISRAVLRRDGHDIEYRDRGPKQGAAFVIKPRSDSKGLPAEEEA